MKVPQVMPTRSRSKSIFPPKPSLNRSAINSIIASAVRASPLFDALMRFQFEARQGWHDEEITMKIAHGLFEHGDLEGFARVAIQQVGAGHGLVEVGSGFRDDGRVSVVDHGLGAAGVMRVHGVTEFMRQRAHAVDVVRIAHHDERIGVPFGTRAENAPCRLPSWVPNLPSDPPSSPGVSR